MKNLRSLLIVPATLLLVFFAAWAPAVADHGGDSTDSNTSTSGSNSGSGGGDSSTSGSTSGSSGSSDSTSGSTSGSSGSGDTSGGSGSSSSTSGDSGSNDTSTQDNIKANDESVTETDKQTAENDFSKQGEDRVNALLNDHAQKHSQEQRAKNCQAAKGGLQTKLQNLQKNAANHKALIDGVYSQALVFQQQNNLNPAGFSDLVNAANAAQAKAAISVAALDGLSVNLDCSSGSVAQNVATFQAAAQQARNDLLTYRNAVQAVLQALENAKA